MEHKERFDNKLIWVNFILACGVVVLHVINNEPAFQTSIWYIQFIWDGISNIANICVPCFFAISGFLFYYNFSWEKLLGKWKRRIATLVIPFLIWNTIIYIYYFIISRIPAFEMEPVEFEIKGFILDVLNSTNSPLWFVRTLTVYIIVSPALIWLWKKRIIGVFMIVALVVSNYLGISTPIISNSYLPMFLLGAYMALYHPNAVVIRGGYRTCCACLGVGAVVLIAFIYKPLHMDGSWLFTLRLLGALSFWFFLIYLTLRRNQMNGQNALLQFI